MFITELWKFNKKQTGIFLLFICLWGYLNYKRGAIATPLMQFGMYSDGYHLSDTQNVVRLYINEKAVDFSKLSMSERDRLQTSLEQYVSEKQNNETVYNTMQRVLNKVGIGRWMQKEYYTNTVTDKIFTTWYISMAEKITNEKIIYLQAFQQKYIWYSGKLTAIASPIKLTCIVDF